MCFQNAATNVLSILKQRINLTDLITISIIQKDFHKPVSFYI